MRSGVDHDDASPAYRRATGLYPLDPPFDYSSANADLMGWVIERVSGKRLLEALSECLWQPIGAESDAAVIVDRSGNARAAAGICATVRDIARLDDGLQAPFAASAEKGEYDRVSTLSRTVRIGLRIETARS
ncbi:hypothetical protein BU16DRAFT_558797 [Lophium mytilinum]|uniref:Beta-lactamase-related domain-containing protein n=1 Tax=Lophium mytilinum TaxID=390894 RepID=A0A6A6R2P1_9PEZI|nr:hypothetical protein BU16DRAFT_558797 [Lophium mytilinum]